MNGFKFTISENSKEIFVSRKADYTKRSVKVSNEINKGIKGFYYRWVKPNKLIDVITIYKKEGYKII
jgi:hypothetical protein